MYYSEYELQQKYNLLENTYTHTRYAKSVSAGRMTASGIIPWAICNSKVKLSLLMIGCRSRIGCRIIPVWITTIHAEACV